MIIDIYNEIKINHGKNFVKNFGKYPSEKYKKIIIIIDNQEKIISFVRFEYNKKMN